MEENSRPQDERNGIVRTTTKASADTDTGKEPVIELITDGSDTPTHRRAPQNVKTSLRRWAIPGVTAFLLLLAFGRFWVVNHRWTSFVTAAIPETQMALSIDYPGYWNTPQEHNTRDRVEVRMAPPYPPKLTVWLSKNLLHKTPPVQHGIHIIIQPNDPTHAEATMPIPKFRQPFQIVQRQIHCPLGIANDRTIIISTRNKNTFWEIRSCQILCDDPQMSRPIAIYISCGGMQVKDKQAQRTFDEIIQHLRLVVVK